jgi:hypothetical protein
VTIVERSPENASITTAIAYLACVYALRGESGEPQRSEAMLRPQYRSLSISPDSRRAQEHLSKALRGQLTPDERGPLAVQGAVLTADAAIRAGANRHNVVTSTKPWASEENTPNGNCKHVKSRGEAGLWVPVRRSASWHAALCASV